MTTPAYISLLSGGAATDLTKVPFWSTELKKTTGITNAADSKLLATPSSSSASAFSSNCGSQTGSCDFGKSLMNNTSSASTTRESDQMETGQKIKRPMNAFMVWSQERRAQIANSESKMHNSQISKELGAEWRKMSAEKKAPYIRRAKELRDELLRQHPDYVYRPKRKPRPQPKTVSNNHSISPSSASAAAAAVKQHMQRSATDGQIPTATAAQFLLATEAQKQQSMMLACQLQTQLFASFLKESQQKKDLLNAAVKQCPAAALPTSLASTGDVGFMPYVGNSQTLGQYLPSDLNLLSTLSSMNAQLHPAFLLNKFAQSQLPQLQSFADVNSQ